MASMLPARHKLVRLHCESLGKSMHAPACEDVRFVALFEAEDGTTIERTDTILAYSRIMSDPEQFPHLIAEALRRIMVNAGTQRRSGADKGTS